MIIANLYNIKATNGLFYYAADYLLDNKKKIKKVLVRREMFESARVIFPDLDVLECSLYRMMKEAFLGAISGDFLYTPTSHPLPFISRQLIVLHDTYPFNGTKGKLKKFLFQVSLATSNCKAAYINRTDGLRFLRKIGVQNDRLVFAPNKYPNLSFLSDFPRRSLGTKLTVGLVGTDSAKKNYDKLFNAVLNANASNLQFLMYGHQSPYFLKIREDFPSISIDLISSDSVKLESFLCTIDLLVSVADQEGFGRPIASALLMGVPTILKDCGVFREFFDSGAKFCVSVEDVTTEMVKLANFETELNRPKYIPPNAIVEAYGSVFKESKK